MEKMKVTSPRVPLRRRSRTHIGEAKSSQNARKFDFSSEKDMIDQEKKNLEEIYYELFEIEDDNFPYHDGVFLFMSVKKAARIRREIEETTTRLHAETSSGCFESLDADLDRLKSLRRYELRSRSEIARRVMGRGKKHLSKLSDLRRKSAMKNGV